MQGRRKVPPSIPCCQLGIHLVAILSIFLSACSALEAENPQLETATVCGTTTVVQRRLSLSASNQSNPKLSCAAFKGNTSTRWLNAFADLQWVQTNLSGVQPIYGVTHEWGAADPKAFQFEVSNDRATWTPIYNTAQHLTSTANASTRYVRMLDQKWATPYSYSPYEFKVQATGGLARFFKSSSYGGAAHCTDADSSRVGTTWNDCVSSVGVQSGYQVQLYGDIDYGRSSRTLTAGVSSPSDFNDQTSSLKLGKTSTGKVVAAYYATVAGAVPRLRDIDPNYNLIYLFAATQAQGEPLGTLKFVVPPDGNGAWSNWSADLQYARNVQQRKMILSVGGAGRAIRFTDRRVSATFVSSVEKLYDEWGGFDGLDFNTFEADADPNTPEMIWIAKELKRRHPGFIITAPPAPWNRRDQTFCKAMLDAQVIDYCAPQYYDGPNLSDPAYLLQNIEIWIDLLGPENVVVGFGVNDERDNYWKIDAVVEAFKKVKAQYPNVKGVFDWRLDWDAQQGYPFARRLAPLVAK